jgi:alkylhydroperoxidase family enzyme
LLNDPELVSAVTTDYRTAPLSDAEKALFAFVDRVNGASVTITREDVDAAKRAGWSEEALYDAITVCALFNFYNRWIDATGVQDMPAGAYPMVGQRLAERGYSSFGSGT